MLVHKKSEKKKRKGIPFALLPTLQKVWHLSEKIQATVQQIANKFVWHMPNQTINQTEKHSDFRNSPAHKL